MSDIKFRIAAKTDVGLLRTNNEDNFQATSDLSSVPMRWVNNQECFLGEKGALLVVADGMGGMNAGEVASELAIDTIRECFAPQNLTDEVLKNRYSIERFMKKSIEEADIRIKKVAKEKPETKGMGTTIVVAWFLGKQLYVSWCGDSRAYVFNPRTGLYQITKDHSYVQDLVDKDLVSKQDAFDYPDSNIITRSLSDIASKAKPDCLLMPHELCNDDIILLCTDGLCGMIRDNEIEEVMVSHADDMDACVNALIKAACDASGADNITVSVCQILSGGAVANISQIPVYPSQLKEGYDSVRKSKSFPWLSFLLSSFVCLLIGFALGFFWRYSGNKPQNEPLKETVVVDDTLSISKKAEDRMPKVTSDKVEPSPIKNTENVGDSPKKADDESSTVREKNKGLTEKASSSKPDTIKKGNEITPVKKDDAAQKNEIGKDDSKNTEENHE